MSLSPANKIDAINRPSMSLQPMRAHIVVGHVDDGLQQWVAELSKGREVQSDVLGTGHLATGHDEPLALDQL